MSGVLRSSISIPAPREGSDGRQVCAYQRINSISIHAPREGSDLDPPGLQGHRANFNPRSPRGERPGDWLSQGHLQGAFQSTLPARGATDDDVPPAVLVVISIHAPREGSDPQRPPPPRRPLHFNPRSPRGERPVCSSYLPGSRYFNPRSPRGERHGIEQKAQQLLFYFNPRSPRGERQQNVLKYRREFWVKRQLIKQNWET